MTTVHVHEVLPDDERRALLYAGDLFVLPPTPASLALAELARAMITEGFRPHDPREAQWAMGVEDWVGRFAPVKPAFIHDDRTAELVPRLLAEAGCDPDDTYWDVPRLRGVTSDGYLTAGVGYAHGPHRDTWYSAPLAQLNWWMPLWPCRRDSVMSFFPRYAHEALPNSSDEFDYYRWNAEGRRTAAQHVHADTRRQPTATVPVDRSAELRVVTEVGSLLVFSAAQLHATVPNTTGSTRFSIDLRTVCRSDLEAGRGFPNHDSAPTGTSLRDFHRCRDGAALPDDLVERFDTGSSSSAGATLVFRP